MEVHVTNWETDIELFFKATDEIFPEQLKKMMLIDLCPDALNKHLRARGHLPKFDDYDAIKVEISDWLADQAGVKGGRAAALEPVTEEPSADVEAPWPEEDERGEIDPANLTDGQLRALANKQV